MVRINMTLINIMNTYPADCLLNEMNDYPFAQLCFCIYLYDHKPERMKFPEIKRHLNQFTVGIAGAGGLGSNCAVALARTGIGSLVLCDHDIVEKSNLNRQYYFINQVGIAKTEALKDNIARIDPKIVIITCNVTLDPSNIPVIFSGCDVIVEAFDSREMKEMLIETVQDKMKGIPLVVGSGLAGWGRSEELKYRKIDESLYVCGDESTEVSDEMPPLAPRVTMVAGMQANTVVEILMRREPSRKH
jgi:sulfur carrier protein ThiS adenylyltransferase